MGKVALLFAGQGAQYPGMGKDFYEQNPAAREVLATLEEQRPGTMQQCFSGRKEELSGRDSSVGFCGPFGVGAGFCFGVLSGSIDAKGI